MSLWYHDIFNVESLNSSEKISDYGSASVETANSDNSFSDQLLIWGLGIDSYTNPVQSIFLW